MADEGTSVPSQPLYMETLKSGHVQTGGQIPIPRSSEYSQRSAQSYVSRESDGTIQVEHLKLTPHATAGTDIVWCFVPYSASVVAKHE